MKKGFRSVLSLLVVALLLVGVVPTDVLAEETSVSNDEIPKSINENVVVLEEEDSKPVTSIVPVPAAVLPVSDKTSQPLVEQAAPQNLPANETTLTSAIEGDFEYTDVEGGVSITRCNAQSMDVVIPDSLGGKKVVAIGALAFNPCQTLTSITIPESVTAIGDFAFYACIGLTGIMIPDSVSTIGIGAFVGCIALKNFSVDANNLKYTSIEGVLYDKALTTLVACPGSSTGITIPESVTAIGSYAFYGCRGLTNITIPNSVSTIGKWAFYGSGLSSITIPNSVSTIGEWAFASTHLTSITIPNSVSTIGVGVFWNCRALKNISVDANNLKYTSIEGVLYDNTVTTLIVCPGSSTSVTIPESVTAIGDDAFALCYDLTNITIPNSVITIGNNAFSGCSRLSSVTIPTNVTAIGQSAFEGCNSLINITIPNSVTAIDYGAFAGCIHLTSITIPNSVTSIGDNAFWECKNLSIYGISGSRAETYAKMNSIPFVDINSLFGVKSFTATPENGQYVNSAIQLAAEGQNGKAPYQYNFYYKQGTETTIIQEFSATATAVFKPAAAGVYTLCVEIKDADGKSATKNIEGYTVQIVEETMIGDVDGNGQVQAYDALMALQIAIGIKTVIPSEIKAADVDGIGGVKAYDALRILQYTTGKITAF